MSDAQSATVKRKLQEQAARIKRLKKCSSFITHPIITQIWIQYSHVVAPKKFTMEFYKGIIGK